MTTDPIKDLFEEAAPPRISPHAARVEFAAMAPRFRTARRRHRVRLIATSALCALGLSVGGSAVLAAVAVTPTDPISDPTSSPDTPPQIGERSETGGADHDLDPGGSSEPGEVRTHDDRDLGADRPNAGEDPVDPADEPEPTTGSGDADASSPPNSDLDDNGDAETETEGGTYTENSAGGSVTVELVGGELALVSLSPADGFTADVKKNEHDEVEVRFSEGDDEWRVVFKLDDGQIKPEIKRHDSDGEEGDEGDEGDENQDGEDEQDEDGEDEQDEDGEDEQDEDGEDEDEEDEGDDEDGED